MYDQWLTDINQAVAKIANVRSELNTISNALKLVGNKELSKKISDLAWILYQSADTVHNAVEHHVITDYQEMINRHKNFVESISNQQPTD